MASRNADGDAETADIETNPSDGGRRVTAAMKKAAAAARETVASKKTTTKPVDTKPVEYKNHFYERTKYPSDAVAVLCGQIGMFTRALSRNRELNLIQPLCRFTLPEVDYENNMKWARKTTAETDKVMGHLLARSRVLADSLSHTDDSGITSAKPVVDVLGRISDIETKITDFLKTNRDPIATNATELRVIVRDLLKTACASSVESADYNKNLILTLITAGHERKIAELSKLNIASKYVCSSEEWDGVRDLEGFVDKFASASVSQDDKYYRDTVKQQEELGIDIAISCITYLKGMYGELSAVIGVNGFFDKLPATVLAEAKAKSSSGCVDSNFSDLVFRVKGAAGLFMWELVLERIELLWSNVFSFFTLIVGGNTKSAYVHTRKFMKSAIPWCMIPLFQTEIRFQVGFDGDVSNDVINEKSTMIKSYYDFLDKISDPRALFTSVTVGLFSGISTTELENLKTAVKAGLFTNSYSAVLNSTPSVAALGLCNTERYIASYWDLLDKTVIHLPEPATCKTRADLHLHVLVHEPNRIRDLISMYIGQGSMAAAVKHNLISKVIRLAYCTEGAFNAVYFMKKADYTLTKEITNVCVRSFHYARHSPLLAGLTPVPIIPGGLVSALKLPRSVKKDPDYSAFKEGSENYADSLAIRNGTAAMISKGATNGVKGGIKVRKEKTKVKIAGPIGVIGDKIDKEKKRVAELKAKLAKAVKAKAAEVEPTKKGGKKRWA